jgi:hypothetical protein
MKKYLAFSTIILSLFFFAKAINAQSYTAYLNAAQEVPASGTAATGKARVVINETALTITYSITFSNLSSAQILGHIHGPAAVGANAGVQITFPVIGGTSGTISGSTSITATQVARIRSGLGYVNIHSANFTGGEIRGQLAKNRPVDFDGDGRTDFSVLRFPGEKPPVPNPITYYNLRSTDGFQAQRWGDANIHVPVPGDYDGDGKDDFAVYSVGLVTSDFYIIRSSDSTVDVVHWGNTATDRAVCRDYDGDGITDIAVFRLGANAGDPAFWYIRQSTNGALRAVQWGTTGFFPDGDKPVPGDYDGDGKFDIAVYRFGGLSPSNSFLILRSSDGGFVTQSWGNYPTDYIAPGDFDGDGKTDLVAARTGANGSDPMIWYILRSSDAGVTVRAFGLSSDHPAQGDYDGDGKTDVAVFRDGANMTSQSTFYILRSFDNSFQAMNWGLGGDYSLNTFDTRRMF